MIKRRLLKNGLLQLPKELIFKLNYRVERNDNDIKWLTGNATSIKDPLSNQIIGYIGKVSDISYMYHD